MDDFQLTYESARGLLADLFGHIPNEDKFLPRSRNYAKNSSVCAFAYALLHHFVNIKPFVLEAVVTGRFSLEKDRGINHRPLFNDNIPEDVKSRIFQIFGVAVEDLTTDSDRLLALLRQLNDGNFLGRSTRAKMSYLKPITGKAYRNLGVRTLQKHVLEVITVTVELLERQRVRLLRQAKRVDHIDALLWELIEQYLICRIESLQAGYPLFARKPELFYEIYADEIAQLFADQAVRCPPFVQQLVSGFQVITKRGIEVTYAKRDRGFLFLGDYYGDCTAWEVRSQVDPQVANIHWTVYAWLLDPYYRVLEVMVDGKAVLKGHIMPLTIHHRMVLMIDAIETIPSLRDYVRGEINRNKSEKLYKRRFEILETLFSHVKSLADRMGIESVYVDKYSNTKWVRAEVDKLPSDSYHISDVDKPYQTGAIADVIKNLIGEAPVEIYEEIQAANVTLMDQYLQANHKEIGVLRGRRDDYSIAIRGI